MLVVPQLFPGLGIERIDVIERGRDVHHAVDHDRGGLQRFLDLGLEDPGCVQLLHVRGIDLAVRIEALLGIVAVGVQKVVAVGGRLLEHAGRGRRCRRGRRSLCSSHATPEANQCERSNDHQRVFMGRHLNSSLYAVRGWLHPEGGRRPRPFPAIQTQYASIAALADHAGTTGTFCLRRPLITC
jgi:hypothetical protein